MDEEKKPRKPIDSMIDEFDVYFREYFGSGLPVAFVQDIGWKPLTDVYETDDTFIVRIEIGGIAPEDVETGWEGDVLVIRGNREEQRPRGRRLYHKIEITTGPFERRITVPPRVSLDRNTRTMQYRNGILEVRVKKIHPE